MKQFKYWFKNGICLGFSVFFVLAGLGCTSTRKTTKTETVVTQSNDAATNEVGHNSATTVSASDQQGEGSMEKSRTTTTSETKSTGHPGILSSTVHAIGWVIALPFRLIGGLIGWIF